MQVQENIFAESNDLIKSVQVMLDALNKLRLSYVNERAGSSFTPSKRELTKVKKILKYHFSCNCECFSFVF